MVVQTLSEEVFACYRRSCAPPPVGTGGSNKGGARGGDKARRAGIASAKEKSSYFNIKKRFGPDQEKALKAEHEAVVRAGKKAKFRHSGGRKRSGSDPMEGGETSYSKYRALQAQNRAKKGR